LPSIRELNRNLCGSSGQAAAGSLPSRDAGAAATRTSLPLQMPPGKQGHKRKGNLMGRQGKASIHPVSLNCGISNLLLEPKNNKVSHQTSSLSRAIHSRGLRQHLTPRPATLISNFSSKQMRYEAGIFLPSPSFHLGRPERPSL